MFSATLLSVSDLISHQADQATILPATKPQPAEDQTTAHRATSRADRIFRGIALVVCVLLAEAALAAGACDVTKDLLDSHSNAWLANTYTAVATMLGVAAILLLADVVAMGMWLGRRGK